MSARDVILAAALAAAERRLGSATAQAKLFSRKALFQKNVRGIGIVRFDWPGVLRVFDPKMAELIAESECGKPERLSASFISEMSDTRSHGAPTLVAASRAVDRPAVATLAPKTFGKSSKRSCP